MTIGSFRGLFHELGHNMQRSEWTFDGATEVTVNIFSMHAMQFVVGIPMFEQKWLLYQKEALRQYFATQRSYDSWKNNVTMAFFMFVQLIKHFGWQQMYKFLANYEIDIKRKQICQQTIKKK